VTGKHRVFPLLFLFAIGPVPLAVAVEVEPLRVELTAAPGSAAVAVLKVTNYRSDPVRIHAQTGAYRYAFTAHTVLPDDPAKHHLPSCQSWVSIDTGELPLGPAASGALILTVAVPQDAAHSPVGEYVAAILVDEHPQPATPSAPGAGTVAILPRIAIPLYVTLEGRQTPRGRIAAFTATPGPKAGIVQLLLTIANDGETHVRPMGTVLVTNDRREVVHRAGLGRTVPIFPQFQEGLPLWVPLGAGRYTAIATVDLGGPGLLQRELTFTVTADGQVPLG